MPSYELLLLLRIMPKTEVASTLKRTADAIFEQGGIIRKLENLGTKAMPFKTSSHGQVHRKASYFLLEFDVKPTALADLTEFYGRDIDIIRRRIFKLPDLTEETSEPCTLHEEIQPPAYRADVKSLMAAGKKNMRPKFTYNSTLVHYPFQK